MNVYITGLGIVSSIGCNEAEVLQSFQQSKTGITGSLCIRDQHVLAAEVKKTNEELLDILGLRTAAFPRTSLLAMLAARQVWNNELNKHRLRTGLVSATTVGGMDRSEKFYFDYRRKSEADWNLLKTHDNGCITNQVADYISLNGYRNTISTACSSSANAIMLGARMLRQNQLDCVVAGGSDALTAFTMNGFRSLMIYDSTLCKPFDEHRNGLNLGEGSAFLRLETERSISLTGHQPLCELAGWHNAADAYHQTASSPEGTGAVLAMENAIEKARLKPADVSYINAHGTGTRNNDLSESIAFQKVFSQNVPPFSSTKGFTGHTLSAAGAIESVFSVLSITREMMLPSLGFQNVMSETGLVPVYEFKTAQKIKVVLSNSFGFGGNNTSLVFKSI